MAVLALSRATPLRPLSGRVAVVTNASSGLGAVIAQRLARDGAAVALLARHEEPLDGLAATIIRAKGLALALNIDVTHEQAEEEAAQVIANRLGVVDLVINNVDGQRPWPPAAGWHELRDVNLMAAVRAARTFAKPLRAAAEVGRPADLINLSSRPAPTTSPLDTSDDLIQLLLGELTQQLRGELGPHCVRVTNLEAGLVDTAPSEPPREPAPRTRGNVPAEEPLIELSPEDIADVITHILALPRHIAFRQLTLTPTQQP
jgi:NADP-dependent 3-hydroxy acid dehydrogenase YdfG